MPTSVSAWLERLGLSEYACDFEKHEISVELLSVLTEQDLREIGIDSVGHRKRIARAIEELHGVATPGKVPVATSGVVQLQVAPEPAPVEEEEFRPIKLFLSYGRDELVPEVRELKRALEARGHEVWFDEEQLVGGLDWEQRIEAGLAWCDRVVLTMTPHSVRRPDGYCLNELAKALERQKPIIPVLMSDVPNGAPTSICRIQYLDWRDAVPAAVNPERFRARVVRLCEAIEHDRLDFEGGQQRLHRALQPLNYSGDIERHVARFTGRKALFGRLRRWLDNPSGSQLLWLCGGSGVGKSAIAAMLAHRWGEVGAVHFCVAGHADKADPRRAILSIAFQLSTKIDAYRSRIISLDLERVVEKGARALFDALLVAPLGGDMVRPGHPWLVVVDALDEANGADGQNELAELLGQEWRKLPNWLRLTVTAQAEGEVRTWLAEAELVSLSAEDPDHRADLEEFLRSGLTRQRRAVSDDAVRRILERSDGAFQYVFLLLEEIRQERCDPDDEVALPRGMQAAYLQAFKRRFIDVTAYQSQYLPLLEVVLASPDPVPIAVVASTCAVSPSEVRRRLVAMGSMLAVQRSDESNDPRWDTLRLAQSSLRSWLTSVDDRSRQRVAGAYAADPQQGLQALARDVLRRWDESVEKGENPSAFVSRVLLGVLVGCGLQPEADRIAVGLARYWSKLSISKAWPAALHSLQWADRERSRGILAPSTARMVTEARLIHAELAAARGESSAALESIGNARENLDRLLRDAPEDVGLLRLLAKCRQQAAGVVSNQGRLPEALAEQQAAVGILERLQLASAADVELTSEAASSLNALGNILKRNGDLDSALAAYQRSLALRQELVRSEPTNREYRRNIGSCHNNIGNVLAAKGDLEGTLRERRRFHEIAQALHEEEPRSQAWRWAMSVSHRNTSITLEELGRFSEALAEAQCALRLRARLADEEPDNTSYLDGVADSHGQLSDLLTQQGVLASALDHARATLAIAERAVEQDPSNLSRQYRLGDAHWRVATIFDARGLTEQAVSGFAVALAIVEQLAAEEAPNPMWKSSLVGGEMSIAGALRGAGRVQEAVEHTARAVALGQSLISESGENARSKSLFARALWGHARTLQAANRLEDAAEAARASVVIGEALIAKDLRNAQWRESLARSLGCVGSIVAETGRTAEAEPALLRARDIVAALVAGDTGRAEWLDLLSDLHREIGWLRERQNRMDEAVSQHQDDLRISQSLAADRAGHVGFEGDVALAHLNVGWGLLRLERYGDAVRELQTAVGLFASLADPQRPGSLVDAAGAAALLERAIGKAGVPLPAGIDLVPLKAFHWPPGAVDSAFRRRLAQEVAAQRREGV